jgi:hypothetical protein
MKYLCIRATCLKRKFQLNLKRFITNLADMSRGVDSWIRSDFVNGRGIASWLSYLCCFYKKEKRVTS